MILNARGIENFNVEKRIDIKVTSFNFNLLSKYNPIELMQGKKISYELKNQYGNSGGVLFNGRIEKIDDTIDPTKRVFSIGGRNVALFLEEQPFYSPCYGVSTGVKRTRTMQWLLSRIRTGTGCKLGPEILSLDESFTNDPADNNCYCGTFQSRKDAIDWLLKRYGDLNGKAPDWFYWWVDTGGYIRLMDRTSLSSIPTLTLSQFPSKNILSIKIGINVQTIENDVTVIGGEENDIRARLYDMDSIRQYGRRPSQVIIDSSLTSASAVEQRCRDELENRKKEIYVGEIVTAGFPETECGYAIKLLFSERYVDKKFIFTSIRHEGAGNYQTVIGISTDENVIVNPNLSDLVQQMIDAKIKQLELSEASVVAVDQDAGTVDIVPVSNMSEEIAMERNAGLAGGGIGGGGGISTGKIESGGGSSRGTGAIGARVI